MKHFLLVISLPVVLASVSEASVLFDFESVPASTTFNAALYTSLSMTDSGVTVEISRSGGASFGVWQNDDFLPGSWGSRALSAFAAETADDWFVADFSTGLFSASIDMGDFGADVDALFLEAYSGLGATGTLLDSMVVQGYGGSIAAGEFGTLAVSDSGGSILSLRFRGGGSLFPNSVYYDNLEVEAVPEPGTLLALAGLGVWGAARRRRA